MAHSYMSTQNSSKERVLALRDTIIYVYMFLFKKKVEQLKITDDNKNRIYHHYIWELSEQRTSYINLLLEEINRDVTLKKWYLSIIDEIASDIQFLPKGFVDNEILNKELISSRINFTKPIPINRILNVINDICWLLFQDNIYPSEDNKWFENSVPQSM